MATLRTSTGTHDHKVVSQDQWIAARKELLQKEKEFTRLRDDLSRQRRELPWTKVEKKYTFDGPRGKQSLADLFDGHSQLIIYHFMLGPGWEEGCKSCSFIADHFNSFIVHLNARDVSLAAVSRAPLDQVQAFKKRMGWTFNWVSSYGGDFNYDYHVSKSDAEKSGGKMEYNYTQQEFPSDELPGLSVFYKDPSGEIFHTYSAYSRGLDILLGAYNFLDMVPKGRDEEGLSHGMAWVRHHDRYGDGQLVNPKIKG